MSCTSVGLGIKRVTKKKKKRESIFNADIVTCYVTKYRENFFGPDRSKTQNAGMVRNDRALRMSRSRRSDSSRK